MPLTGQAKVDYQRAYMRRRRAGQLPLPKPEKAPEVEAAKVVRCSFCREPSSPTRIVVGDGFTHICEACVAEAAGIIAAKKQRAAA